MRVSVPKVDWSAEPRYSGVTTLPVPVSVPNFPKLLPCNLKALPICTFPIFKTVPFWNTQNIKKFSYSTCFSSKIQPLFEWTLRTVIYGVKICSPQEKNHQNLSLHIKLYLRRLSDGTQFLSAQASPKHVGKQRRKLVLLCLGFVSGKDLEVTSPVTSVEALQSNPSRLL